MDKEISLSKKIGLVIKRYRECKGLSQEIVSGFAGISRSNLANIERGRYDSISITKLKKWLMHLKSLLLILLLKRNINNLYFKERYKLRSNM